MARVPTPAVIIIVLVACLAVTALGAALFRRYNPSDAESRYTPPHNQGQYMRTVRMRNYTHLKRASLEAKDIESRCTFFRPYQFLLARTLAGAPYRSVISADRYFWYRHPT